MDEKTLKQAIAELNKTERKFTQSYDLLYALKELNLKKPEEQVDFYMQLPNNVGKKKVCALVGPELVDDAKKVCDTVIALDDFSSYDKKKMKKVASEHDWFIGQANIMPKIAASWGRVLGPRAKMPNPKAGCIVPPKTSLEPLYERLQSTVRVEVKKQPNIQVMVGTQKMDEEKVIENILAVHNQVVHHLPREENNLKNTMLKLTMSKPVKL